MKKLLFAACIVCFAVSCDSKTDTTASTGSDTTKVSTTYTSWDKLEFPYELDHPYNDWQQGDPQHAVMAMKGLKAWENNNIAESVSYFGDSVMLRFDNFNQKLPHDSLAGFFSYGRNQYDKVSIRMDDWESVISKDKKEEWVTLWYKQITTDKKGKVDSVSVVNDAKIENGKIVTLSEAVRRYPGKKAM